jgi:hypothetical protein
MNHAWKVMLVTTLAVLVCLTTAGQAQAAHVFAAKLAMSGAAQDEEMGMPRIEKIRGTGQHLVSLAMGRSVDDPAPANQIFALVVDTVQNQVSLVVFDTNTSTVLATIATQDKMSRVADLKKGQYVLLMEVKDVGGPNNRINGGYLVLTGTYQTPTGDAPSLIKANVTGVLDVKFTDDVGTSEGEILVSKGKLSTGKVPIAGLNN